MRLTLLPATPVDLPMDVEARVGVTVGELRPHLARLTGRRGWTTGTLAVADRVVADSHTVGHAPLVTGAALRIGRGTPDAALLAVEAPWHLAVLAGPRCGELIGVHAGTPVRVGGLRVEVRRGRVVARGRMGWRRWRVGRRRALGADTIELRAAHPEQPRKNDPHAGTWLTPVLGAAALAVVLHQPLFLLVALAAPLAAGLPRAVRILRSRPAAAWRGGLGRAHAHMGATQRDRPRGQARTNGRDGADGRSGADGRDGAHGQIGAGGWDGAGGRADDVDDVAAVVARTAAAARREVPAAQIACPWGADGSLALVGPRALTLPRARALVVGTVGSHGRVGVVVAPGEHADDWDWCRWVATGSDLPRPDDRPCLVVLDGPADPARVAAWRQSAPVRHRLLVLVESVDAVPAWCSTWIEDAAIPCPLPAGVHLDVAEEQARRAAGVRESRRPLAAVPAVVELGTLPTVPAPRPLEVAAAWQSAPPTPTVALGRGAGGAVVHLNLVRDGPHALVGGTTGAGKSELLVTLVLGCALTQPPDRLALLLVDFKGGTGLGPVAALPHVVEHVTDLDGAAAVRLLTGLRAELRRRERLLAIAGARDLSDLDPAGPSTPPRLVVVVDELRALVEDVPDASATLARLAAQGRALGMHLVLATQRPGGAVGADLRANIGLRIALRVQDDADSTDLVGAGDAARIPADRPGRAVVRVGAGPLEHVQVARAVSGGRRLPVRPAVAPAGAASWRPLPLPVALRDDDVTAWVRSARGAADALPAGRRRPTLPWLPALPELVTTADLRRTAADGVPDEARASGLPLALSDEPDQQRRDVVRWSPDDGHLLVVGGPRSGRSTTLVTVGLAALAAGRHVHAIGLPRFAADRLSAAGSDGLGSLVATDEPRLVARLLELLADGPPKGQAHGIRPVLLVDGLDAVLDALAVLARGAGADRLTALWRGGPATVGLAITCDARTAATAHAAAFRDRLVLPVPDAGTDLLVGVPAALAGPRAQPGRAVHQRGTMSALCQVAMPPLPAQADARSGTEPRPDRRAGGAVGPPRLRVLPSRAARPRPQPGPASPGVAVGSDADGSRSRPSLPLGVGGDDAGELGVRPGPGLLVCGPPGSGRSTTLRTLVRSALDAGLRVLVAGSETDAGDRADGDPDAAGRDPLLAGAERLDVATPLTLGGAGVGSPRRAVVVVDDVDELERSDPELCDRITDLATNGAIWLVVSSTSAAATSAFRGPLPWLLRRRAAVVLDPGDPASAEVIGPRAPWLVDPGHIAGRAVLVDGRTTTPVQVYDAAASRPP